ncbi:cyclase family protein [Gammaproteobacteria bacterium]|nr:cyclase family protein [Gammaproteobacteria bacterium]
MDHLKTFFILVFMISTNALSAQKCEPSKWGEADEIGSANYVTPEQVIMASKLVKQGNTHPLGIVIEPGMPAFPPRYTQLQVVQPGQQFGVDGMGAFGWHSSYNDDVLQMWLGTGPQLDGLGHMGESGQFYNCNMGKDFSEVSGLTKLGIEKVPPLVGRGVLLDMAEYFEVDSMTAGQPITSEDIKKASKAQGIKIGKGDVVLFHTGWTDAKLKSEPNVWVSTIPGITNDAAVYLATLSPMAVGADTWGIGAVPPIEGDKIFYDHITLLKENGVFLLETMNTGHLAREGVKEFMFVLGQARLKGAVQMIINPVALW